MAGLIMKSGLIGLKNYLTYRQGRSETVFYTLSSCVLIDDRANGDWRCITLDNHESHISLEFIEYAWDHQIIVVSLPPKTSGKLQPLDVAIFRTYQKEYGRAVQTQVGGGVTISKQDFPRYVHYDCFVLS